MLSMIIYGSFFLLNTFYISWLKITVTLKNTIHKCLCSTTAKHLQGVTKIFSNITHKLALREAPHRGTVFFKACLNMEPFFFQSMSCSLIANNNIRSVKLEIKTTCKIVKILIFRSLSR